MSEPSPELPTGKPIAVARPKRGVRIPSVEVADDDDTGDSRSRWELHGWAASVLIHLALLVVLGLWYFTLPPSQVRTFDSRLEGSNLGPELGMMELGGIDTPIALPESITPPSPTSTLERIRPIELATDPTAGMPASLRNPGAGQGEGFGLAKYGSGGETVKGVEVKVGDPQFTLIWESNADLDLHVVEPGGKEIFWNDTKGRFGGMLDVDNVDGFGPENIYWLKLGTDGSKELGPGPPGEYRWFVEYYGGNRGIPVPTRWTVRVKHEGRVEFFHGRLTVPKARSRNYTLKMTDPDADTAANALKAVNP